MHVARKLKKANCGKSTKGLNAVWWVRTVRWKLREVMMYGKMRRLNDMETR